MRNVLPAGTPPSSFDAKRYMSSSKLARCAMKRSLHVVTFITVSLHRPLHSFLYKVWQVRRQEMNKWTVRDLILCVCGITWPYWNLMTMSHQQPHHQVSPSPRWKNEQNVKASEITLQPSWLIDFTRFHRHNEVAEMFDKLCICSFQDFIPPLCTDCPPLETCFLCLPTCYLQIAWQASWF